MDYHSVYALQVGYTCGGYGCESHDPRTAPTSLICGGTVPVVYIEGYELPPHCGIFFTNCDRTISYYYDWLGTRVNMRIIILLIFVTQICLVDGISQ